MKTARENPIPRRLGTAWRATSSCGSEGKKATAKTENPRARVSIENLKEIAECRRKIKAMIRKRNTGGAVGAKRGRYVTRPSRDAEGVPASADAAGCFSIARILDIKAIRENAGGGAEVSPRPTRRGGTREKKIDEASSPLTREIWTLSDLSGEDEGRANRVSKEIGALMGEKNLSQAEAKKAETKDRDKISAIDKGSGGGRSRARRKFRREFPNVPFFARVGRCVGVAEG